MSSFEQIRSHVDSHYRIVTNDPYLIGIELSLAGGSRHQALFLAELEADDGEPVLRVSTAIAPITGIDARRALAFNWQQRAGYLAVSDLDGIDHLQLCENRPIDSLQLADVDRLILEIGGLGDRLESALLAGGDLF